MGRRRGGVEEGWGGGGEGLRRGGKEEGRDGEEEVIPEEGVSSQTVPPSLQQ